MAKTRRIRNVPIMFYVTSEEKAVIVKRATDNDQTVSDFCRQTLIKEPEKEAE